METIHNTLGPLLGYVPPNYDPEAKIHYGYINKNALNLDVVQDIYDNGDNLSYKNAWDQRYAEIHSELVGALCDNLGIDENLVERICGDFEDQFQEDFSEHYEEQGDTYEYFDTIGDNDYHLTIGSDGDICVLKSKYFTYCRECSPCAPNGGYLTSQPGNLKTYCLDTDWFEDRKCPYPIYLVENGNCIYTPAKEEDDEL